MIKYQVSEASVESLTPDQIRKEASDLRYQLTCVTVDISSKKCWGEADDKQATQEYKIWMARARDFWKKLSRRYAAIRPLERKLNRADGTSKRHVSRAEFEKHITETEGNPS